VKQKSFRFETLLKIREQKQDASMRAVAARLRAIQAITQRQESLQLRITQETAAIRESLQKTILDVDQLKWERHWLTRLRLGVLEADAEIAGHRAMLAQERAALTHARKETKVLSLLKERMRESFLAEQDRRQQRDLDELNTARHAFALITEHE
jgi:flagellar export protein FliJ